MKNLIFSMLFMLMGIDNFAQNIGIGTNNPHASSLLDVSSTNRGLLAPRMTTAQRMAIAGPAKGLLVYDTDENALYHYNGSVWAQVGGSGGAFTLPYSNSLASASALFSLTNTGQGKGITAASTASFTAAIEGSGLGTGGYGVVGNSSSVSGYGIYGINPTGTAVYGFSTDGGVALRGNSPTGYALLTNGNLRLTGGNTNPSAGAVLTSTDVNGNAVWKPSGIAFSVFSTANTSVTENEIRKIEFVDEQYDFGNTFTAYAGTTTNTSSVFTAPVAGIYHFSTVVALTLNSSVYNFDQVEIKLIKNGTAVASTESTPFNQSGISETYNALDIDVRLAAGDKIWVSIRQVNAGNLSATTIQNGAVQNFFTGHLVFAE
jgi:hypothetical protein